MSFKVFSEIASVVCVITCTTLTHRRLFECVITRIYGNYPLPLFTTFKETIWSLTFLFRKCNEEATSFSLIPKSPFSWVKWGWGMKLSIWSHISKAMVIKLKILSFPIKVVLNDNTCRLITKMSC